MRRPARLAACLAIAGLAACSLLVDTNGLSGGVSGAGEGGPSNDAPSGSDAPSSPDGTSGDDAGADAPHDGDASTGFVCDATFCDDFDTTGLGATWTDKTQQRGTLTLASESVTPPSSMLVTLAAGTGNGDIELMKSFPGLPKQLRCELDMKIVDAPPSNAEIDYLYFTTRSTDPKSYLVYFVHFDTGWAIAEYAGFGDGGTLDRMAPASTPPIGSWFHVTFQTDGSTVSVAYNGLPAGSLGGLSSFGGTEKDVNLGIPYVTSGPTTAQPHSVEYDDVACHVGP